MYRRVFLVEILFSPAFRYFLFVSIPPALGSMSFLQSFMIRLRLQRRRHKQLFLLISVTIAAIILFVLWSSKDALDTSVSSTSCKYVPGFICSLFFIFEDPKPADISGSPKKLSPGPSGTGSLGHDALIQPKMDHINSFYKGENAQKLVLAHKFYAEVLKDIVEAKPDCAPLEDYKNGRCNAERFETSDEKPMYSEKYLSQFLQLNKTQLDAMMKSHKYILGKLPNEAPKGLYEGDGIVYVGGGKFNWLSLLSVRALRAQGCQLPVEILVPTLEEYELELCSRIFPAMNAKCIYLPTALFGNNQEMAKSLTFKGYQYKSLAILLSSFENVLLMDSDNVPAYSPEHLFKSEPFTKTGLVVWPDFWQRSTSPDYYKIAGSEVSKTELLDKYSERFGGYLEQEAVEPLDWLNCPYHERVGAIPNPSSESGQLMISKKSHMKAILLAFYYNLYGPGFYYPLFSQGAQGEGDKETFLAATIVTKGKYYQVGKFLAALGNVRNNEFNGNAMGQYDPAEDLEWNRQKKKLLKSMGKKEAEEAIKKLKPPKIIFVHANTPKLDPWELKNGHDTVDEEGNRYRLYGWGMRSSTGTDFELNTWNHMKVLLCDMNLNLDHFKDINRKQLCHEINEHITFLVSTQDRLD